MRMGQLGTHESLETQPLLPHATPPKTRWQRFKTVLARVNVNTLAFLLSISNLINGTMAESNAPARNIIRLSWWQSLPTGKIVLNVINGLCSLGINYLINAFYLPLAVSKVKYHLGHFKSHPIRSLNAIILGIAGAIGAGAIAYAAFNWFSGASGEIFAGSMALFNFIAFITTRFVGAANTLERLSDLFNPDVQTQKQFVAKLNHVKPRYQVQLSSTYSQLMASNLRTTPPIEPINADQLNRLAYDLALALEAIADNEPDAIFDSPSKREQFLKGLGLFFDITYALGIVSWTTGLIFTQAGFDGVSKIADLASNHDLSDLNIWHKRLIGIIPGISSSLLYTMANFDLRRVSMEFFNELYQSPTPKNIIPAFLLCAATWFSTSSFKYVASSVVHNPNNIVGLTDDVFGRTLIHFSEFAAIGLNGVATLQQTYLPTTSTIGQLKNIDDFTHYLEKVHTHRLSPSTSHHIRRLSLFEPTPHDPLPDLEAAPAPASFIAT